MTKATSEHDRQSLLSSEKLLGEDYLERMSRFGLLVENANGNWDLSDRDENALRTANAVLTTLVEFLDMLQEDPATPREQRQRIDGFLKNARGGVRPAPRPPRES